MNPVRTASTGAPVAALAAVLCLGLAGCISVFPKSNPAQLYRFGEISAAAPADNGAALASRPEIIKGSVDFNQAAAGDRILTVTGQETAYIAESRWVSPASTLFDEALDRAFATNPGAPRLEGFGRGARGVAILRLTVDNFETRYENGPEAAPTVVVRVEATLVSTRNRGVLAETVLESRKPASENRVGPIVQAYDAATTEVLGKLAGWTGGVAAAAPAS